MGIIIQTKRLIIRCWEDKDVPSMVVGLNNINVSSGFGTPYPYTRQMAEAYLLKVKANATSNKYFAIELQSTKEVIGGCGIHFKETQVSISLWLNNDSHNQGFGTEVLVSLARYGFECLNVPFFTNYYYRNNIASLRIQEKIGSLKCDDMPTNSKCKMLLTKERFYAAIQKNKLI